MIFSLSGPVPGTGRRRMTASLFLLLVLALLSSAIACGKQEERETSRENVPETEKYTKESTKTAETEVSTSPSEDDAETRQKEIPEPSAESAEEPAEETLPPPPGPESVTEHYNHMFIASKVNSFLNVRNEPTKDGYIIGKLLKNAGGEILDDPGNGWYHIRSGGMEGYISAEYCVEGAEALRLAPEVACEMVKVTAERLNVRSGPGEKYPVWTQLASDSLQNVKEEINGWYRILINDTDGYISSSFAEKGWYLREAMPWTSVQEASPLRQQLFAYAEQFIGTRYVYGGTSLTDGIDCSSYVQQCFRNALGIKLPRTSAKQSRVGAEISYEDARPGDLMFYTDRSGTVDHVAIYMGDGKILHASLSFGQVAVSSWNYSTKPAIIRNVIGD